MRFLSGAIQGLLATAAVAGVAYYASPRLGPRQEARPLGGSAQAGVQKRPGVLAPAGGTGVPFDSARRLEEEREEGGRQLPADPDLVPVTVGRNQTTVIAKDPEFFHGLKRSRRGREIASLPEDTTGHC